MYSFSVLLVLNYAIMFIMKNEDYIEFSKIYKRVMDVEITLKTRFFNSLKYTYNANMFYVLIPFLKKNLKGRYKEGAGKAQRDCILDLISKKLSDELKLKEFINMAYLSDILKFITEYKKVYKDKKFNKHFYNNRNVYFNDLKKYSSKLKKLRNDIMHFNVQNFTRNKVVYIETLIFWELLLYCQNCFIHTLPPIKPTINNILNQLKDYYPDIYSKSDRYLCDVFDDIALKNNLPVDKLPQYWSIGRQIYIIKKSLHD